MQAKHWFPNLQYEHIYVNINWAGLIMISAAQYDDKYWYCDIFIAWYDIMNDNIIYTIYSYVQELI